MRASLSARSFLIDMEFLISHSVCANAIIRWVTY